MCTHQWQMSTLRCLDLFGLFYSGNIFNCIFWRFLFQNIQFERQNHVVFTRLKDETCHVSKTHKATQTWAEHPNNIGFILSYNAPGRSNPLPIVSENLQGLVVVGKFACSRSSYRRIFAASGELSVLQSISSQGKPSIFINNQKPTI